MVLSDSFGTSSNPSDTTVVEARPSTKRRRLHILYLINDVLHHVSRRHSGTTALRLVTENLQPYLKQLFVAAAAFRRSPTHQQKLHELLDIWAERDYLPRVGIEELSGAILPAEQENPQETGPQAAISDGKAVDHKSTDLPAKETPFLMPALHGDSSTPYYDLPAGNMMPHISPDPFHSINPDLVKPLQLAPGVADSNLVIAVKDFLQDVNRMFDAEIADEETIFADIDELGQPLIRDEVTGELTGGDSYYGWSRSFCEKMKARRIGRDQVNWKRRRGSYSHIDRRNSRKRMRYGSSDSDYQGRGRLRSYSPSRSRSLYRRRDRSRPSSFTSTSRSRSIGSPWPDSERNERRRSPRRPSSRSRSRPHSSRDDAPPSQPPSQSPGFGPPQIPPFHPTPSAAAAALPGALPHPAMLAQFISQNSQLLSAGVPIPQLSASVLSGQWVPPPLYPPASLGLSMSDPRSGFSVSQSPNYQGPAIPVPPPPPPPSAPPRR